jgi:hypothetical protein
MSPARLWGFEHRERLLSSGPDGGRTGFGRTAHRKGAFPTGIEIRFGGAPVIARDLRITATPDCRGVIRIALFLNFSNFLIRVGVRIEPSGPARNPQSMETNRNHIMRLTFP